MARGEAHQERDEEEGVGVLLHPIPTRVEAAYLDWG